MQLPEPEEPDGLTDGLIKQKRAGSITLPTLSLKYQTEKF
jgi:hypothetical protein